MGWTTEGSGDSARSVHTTTGATSMKEHRVRLRDQAEVRSETTAPNRTKRYRTDKEFHAKVEAEAALKFLREKLLENAKEA